MPIWHVGKNLGFPRQHAPAKPRQRRRDAAGPVQFKLPDNRLHAAALALFGRGFGQRLTQAARVIAPCAGLRGRGLGRCDVAAPLRAWQDRIGVGVLVEDAAPVLEDRRAAPHPVENPVQFEVRQSARGAADADAGFAGNGLVTRIEPPGAEVEKAEDRRMLAWCMDQGCRRNDPNPIRVS